MSAEKDAIRQGNEVARKAECDDETAATSGCGSCGGKSCAGEAGTARQADGGFFILSGMGVTMLYSIARAIERIATALKRRP